MTAPSLVDWWAAQRVEAQVERLNQHEMRLIYGDDPDVHHPMHELHASAAIMVKLEAGKRGLRK